MSSILHYLLSPESLLLIAAGTILGIVVGAIPGLTGAMLIALSLPLTFTMEGIDAMVLLVSMYVGSVSGGLITATLLRMPGTPASIMTVLDGFPMAESGRPGRALGLGIFASFFGGIVSWVFLFLLTGPAASLSMHFGPFEFFALVLIALVLIASVSGPSLLRGTLAGFLGMLASMPGVSPATGQIRLTFGFTAINDGFKLLPVLIGLFAVNQVISDLRNPFGGVRRVISSSEGMFLRFSEWRRHVVNLIRSSLIGTWIGILPGIGANIGSVVAYSAAKKCSSKPSLFGHGSEEGIVASETANNATVGGALIPLLAMGIPGSVVDAVLLGAMTIHGLQPGPLLLQQNPGVVYTIIAAVFVSNVFMLVFMILSLKGLSRLSEIRRAYLIPIILTFCVVGSYALANRMFDVWVMLAFGVAGFALERFKYPLNPFVIGFVLAPIAEVNLCSGLMASGGSYVPLFTSPVSLLFLLMSLFIFLRPFFERKDDLSTSNLISD